MFPLRTEQRSHRQTFAISVSREARTRSFNAPAQRVPPMLQPHRPPRIACLATDPLTTRVLMAGQLNFLQQQGFDVTLIASPGADLDRAAAREGVRVISVPMSREIAPLQDWLSLRQLTRVLQDLKPDIVNAGTPKAGLLGMLAATWARVPIRIYTLRGLRLETSTGPKRLLLTTTERVAARCAHKVICVSPSLRVAFEKYRLGTSQQAVVLGGGSSNGVDAARFAPTPARLSEASAIRQSMGIPEGAQVIGFVGRLTRDKGVTELISVFETLAKEMPHLHLMLVGGFEDGDPLCARLRDEIWSNPRVHITGFVNETAAYYSAFDLLVFPSHREGLPNVPLEAAASGHPTAGFAATGTVDAVLNGQTGTLVSVGDVKGLTDSVRRYLQDPLLLARHGKQAQLRVQTEFRREVIWQELYDLYTGELQARGLPMPQPSSAENAVAAA